MICGAGSLPHDHDEPTTSSSSSKKGKLQKNPYSSRGLEKFSTVLAELGAKREKIMARAGGPQGAALVQFVYRNSKDWVPIVVRPKPPAPASSSTSLIDQYDNNKKKKKPLPSTTTTTTKADVRRWRPSYYWPSVAVLVLLCLVMFGRVFAICCTSIWWYMLPTFKDWNANKKMMMMRKKKKEYGRKLSDKRLTAPSSPRAKKA